MRYQAVLYALGRLLQVEAAVLLIPLLIAQLDARSPHPLASPETRAFWMTLLIALLLGSLLFAMFFRHRHRQGVREGFATVGLGWVVLTLVGSLPFLLRFLDAGDAFPLAFTNAYFEIMSGFTTTGATILGDIEAVPRALLFWRSLTHWLGGMGIITLAIAIFPAMGVGGYQMFKGEVPGPTADRLRPRLAETAKVLWGVYFLLTAAQAGLLVFSEMDWFEAICHSFGTMATGGFSTRNASIGAYDSAYIDWVVIIFMFLAGINFLIHYRLLFKRHWRPLRENREFHFYVGSIALAVVLVTLVLSLNGLPGASESGEHFRCAPVSAADHEAHVAAEALKLEKFPDRFRHAAFQVVAIVTTTGYGTADFDVWPRMIGLLFVVLMFWGGCAGSTGGGMKMIRVLITFKAAWREVKKVMRPRLISPLKVRRAAVDEPMVSNIVGFFVMFVGLFVVCSVIMSFFIPDLTTAVASVAATIGNIGPGLSGVGSTQTYAWIPLPGKWVLILCMLLGRLEIFTVLLLLRPTFWRR